MSASRANWIAEPVALFPTLVTANGRHDRRTDGPRLPGWPRAFLNMYIFFYMKQMDANQVKREMMMRDNMRENSNSNSKTLFYKDCSLGSFKNLSNN